MCFFDTWEQFATRFSFFSKTDFPQQNQNVDLETSAVDVLIHTVKQQQLESLQFISAVRHCWACSGAAVWIKLGRKLRAGPCLFCTDAGE